MVFIYKPYSRTIPQSASLTAPFTQGSLFFIPSFADKNKIPTNRSSGLREILLCNFSVKNIKPFPTWDLYENTRAEFLFLLTGFKLFFLQTDILALKHTDLEFSEQP